MLPARCAVCDAEVDELSALPNGLVRCRGCSALLDLGPMRQARSGRLDVALPRGLVPMPASAQVRDSPDRLEIRFPIVRGFWLAALFSTVLLLGALVGKHATAAWLWPIALLIPFELYGTLREYVNANRLTVAGNTLSVGEGPLWWPRKATRPIPDIEQLTVERVVALEGEYQHFRWNLTAMHPDGRETLVLKHVYEIATALWLEQQLEARLGIVDRAVPGEVERPRAAPDAQALKVEPLRCLGCARTLGEAAVSLATSLATCPRCGRVTDLNGRSPRGWKTLSGGSAIADLPVRERPRVPLPARVSVFEAPGGIEVQLVEKVNPNTPGTMGAIFIAIMVFAPFEVLSHSVPAANWAVRGLLVASVLYMVAGLIFGKLRVAVKDKSISVRRVPLPWPGARSWPAKDVRQLYTEKFCEPDFDGNEKSVRYGVSAVVGPEGRRVELVKDLKEVAEALFLEQSIERALGIRDVAVGGEVER